MTSLNTTLHSGGTIKNHGWRMVFIGLLINLGLGIFYTWSVISKNIPEAWYWSEADRSLPYSIACLGIVLSMIIGGRVQDRIGPRLVATVGGILLGGGLLLASTSTALTIHAIGFAMVGLGSGAGYAVCTPTAIKWFPPSRIGMITGIVVSGFGLVPLYAAPLSEWLIATRGIQSTLFILGLAFLIIVVGLSQFLASPPKDFVPEGTVAPVSGGVAPREDFTPSEVLRTWQFYLIWILYACGAGVGLMFISKLALIGCVQAGLKLGFLLVACLGLGNGGGRILTGMLSDMIGRRTTLFLCFILQAFIIHLLSCAKIGTVLATMPVMALISVMIGINYGANLALFPAFAKDFYGLKNFGANYGMVHSAWGLGGFGLSILGGYIYDQTKSFAFAYQGSEILLVVASVFIFMLKAPHHSGRRE